MRLGRRGTHPTPHQANTCVPSSWKGGYGKAGRGWLGKGRGKEGNELSEHLGRQRKGGGEQAQREVGDGW